MTADIPRKIGFVLPSTDHGTMIINRFDYRLTGPNSGFGVGLEILERSVAIHESDRSGSEITVNS